MLDLCDISKRYGDLSALTSCTFQVRPGRLTGFVGPNGAGKTTAMRAIFGLVVPDTGLVRWRGRPVSAADRRRFGYMPEERGLYPKMRVADQLVFLGRLSGLSAAVGVLSGLRVGRLRARLSLGIFFVRVGHGQHCSLCSRTAQRAGWGPVTFFQALKSRCSQCRR